jgi:SP family galactose:H+ symporter-like MFS transporter
LVDTAFTPSEGWRYMFGLAAIPSLILSVRLWRLPDSPRWLVSCSMLEDAKAVLKRVRTEADVTSEITDIQNSLKKLGPGAISGSFAASRRMP